MFIISNGVHCMFHRRNYLYYRSSWHMGKMNLFGIFKKIVSVRSLAEGKGSECIGRWFICDLKSLTWAYCRRLPGVLSGVRATQWCSPTPRVAPEEPGSQGGRLGRGFRQFPHPFGDDEIVLFSLREVKGVGRRLGASKFLRCLFSLLVKPGLHGLLWSGRDSDGLLLPVTEGTPAHRPRGRHQGASTSRAP